MQSGDYFTTRATIRKFSDREVPEALVEETVRRAMKAPTTGNMQLYSVIETRDPEHRKALAEQHFNQPASTGCQLMLTVCADFNRFTRWCTINHADAGFDNLLSYQTAVTDAIIFAQQLTTLLEMQGLGVCWLGTVTYNADKISDLLGLPTLTVPVACLAVGWPEEGGEPTERLGVEAVLHRETYRQDSDEKIVELFRPKDDYAPNQKFIAENGKENLAQVFAEVRYPREMNESFSKSFLQLLKDKKFI